MLDLDFNQKQGSSSSNGPVVLETRYGASDYNPNHTPTYTGGSLCLEHDLDDDYSCMIQQVLPVW